MSDLRKDPIVGRWVIVAKNRADRPQEFQSAPQVAPDRPCPFCEGNEDHTPSEIAAYRASDSAANGPGWRVRVAPNKFPAVELESGLDPRGEGLFRAMGGLGAHEVIIESPAHLLSTADLSEPNVREVFSIYRDRLVELKKDQRLVHATIFKNVGAAAGASLEHVHSQLIAMPITPIAVTDEIRGSLEFFGLHGRCVYCDMIAQEIARQDRLVLETARFAAFCPFASRFPYETWIVPKVHASHYEQISRPELDDLAGVMRQIMRQIEAALDRPAYNYLIHTAPFDSLDLPHYHWHIEIIPRVTQVAGFEWGAGVHINSVPPEEAAARLRNLDLDAPTPCDNTPRDIPLREIR